MRTEIKDDPVVKPNQNSYSQPIFLTGFCSPALSSTLVFDFHPLRGGYCER